MTDKRLESLDLNLLLVLHWLLTERNVTAAASRIGLSQPATSRALARLRQIFDDPLLVKSGGVMAPTPMAEKLQPAIAHAMERCRDVLRVSEVFDPQKQEGSYRIACVDYVGAIVASAWASAVSPEAPGLDLDIVDLTIEASRELVSGRIDLIIVPDLRVLDLPPSVDVDQFVRREIYFQDYMCAVRKGHPLAKSKITLKRFVDLDHILVAPQGAKFGLVDRILEQKGLSRRITYRTYSFLLALPILKRSDCVITAPEGLLALDANSLKIFSPPLDVPGFSMFAGWHPNWTHDERHKWVREKLFAVFKKNNARMDN